MVTVPHKTILKENKGMIFISVGSVLFFLPFFILHGFNFPSADDFSYTLDSIEKGFIESQIFGYKNWCGRFVSTALLSINPLIWQRLDLYRLCSLFNMLLLLFSFYSFVKTVTDILDIKKYRWPGFMLFSILVFAHYPGPSEGLYWLSGYVTYTIPLSLLLLAVSWYLRWEVKNNYNPLKIFLLASMALAVIGCNESLMLELCLFLFFATIFVFLKSKERFPRHLIFLIVSSLGALVVILAPGNIQRKTHFPDDINPFYAFSKSIFSAVEHTLKFISPPLVFFLLLVSLVAYQNRSHKSFQWLGSLKGGFLLGLYFFVMSVGYFPPQVSMGGNPAPRFDNMYYVFFLIFMSLIFANRTLRKNKPPSFFKSCSWFMKPQRLTLFFIISSLFWDNTINAYKDLIWRGPAYAKSNNERMKKIKAHPDGDLVFEPLKSVPKTIFFNGIYSDPEQRNNRFYARYFNLSSVREKKKDKY